MQDLFYVLVGLVAGVFAGIFGVGGGVIIIPVLVILFHFTQHRAQGTSLIALIPPVGLLAAWQYYKEGQADLRAGLLVALGLLFGAAAGAKIAIPVADITLKRAFAVLLVVAAVRLAWER